MNKYTLYNIIRRTLLTLCLMVTATMAWAVDVSTEAELTDQIASSNTDIKLTADIVLTKTLEIDRTTLLTIDLDGHNITANGFRAIHIKQGVVAIKSDTPAIISAEGSVPVDNSVIRLGDGATAIQGTKNTVNMTLGENVTVKTAVETCYGITVFGGSTTETLTVNGKVMTTGRSAVAGNGNAWNDGTTIIIGEKAEITTNNDVAIYQPQDGTLTVSGKVTGAGGIEIKAGKLEVTDKATITATAETLSHTPNNNGTSTRGYAIAIVENEKYTAGVSQVNISKNATIVGPVAMLKDSENANTQEVEFTGDMKMLVKVTDSEGKSFGQYLSLELAMSQAPAGATITLLDNVEIVSTIETNKNYTLDLNGKTVTSDGQRALWIKSGEVTISSTDAGGKIAVPTCSDASAIQVGSDETSAVSLTVGKDVTVSATQGSGILLAGTNTNSLTVNGKVNTTDAPAIAGTKGMTGTTTITVGQNAQIASTNAVAIYQPQNGVLSVDGTVTGAGGIELKSGTLSVGEYAMISATDTPIHAAQTDAPSSLGYAIAIVENDDYAPTDPTITINDKATISGPIAELQDSEKSSFAPFYSGSAVSKKVAAIDNDEYFTLKDAIAIVHSQGTVKLIVDDLSMTAPLVMDVVKTYTLDLNGKTLIGDGCAALQITHGHITLDGTTGSKVTVSGTAPAAIQLGATDTDDNRNVSLTINNNVEVTSDVSIGVLLSGTKTRETLEVKGKITTSGADHIAIKAEDEVAKIHVASGAEVKANDAIAIYQANTGELVVDGKVSGTDVIKMYGGNLKVSKDATITASSTTNYAIAIVEKDNCAGVGRVNISSEADITGVIACLVESQNTSAAEPIFSGDITMVAETQNSNGLGEKYAKLNDAIAEAHENGVVKLLDDLSVTESVSISKAITLDMDDYSIINNQESSAAMTISANATIKNGGIVSGKTGEGESAVEIGNAGISVTGGTVALQNMNVSTKGVNLTVTGGTVTADQKSSFSSSSDNTVALSSGTLTIGGKVLNTSASNPAIAGTDTGVLTVATTATISSATSKAINWNSTGDLTIEGGKIAGAEAVYANAGTVTISGGTFTGTGNAVNIAGGTPSITGGTFYCGANDLYSPIAAASGMKGFVSGAETYFSKYINQDLCEEGYMVSPTPKNNGLFYLIDEIVINDGTQWSNRKPFTIHTAKYIRNSGMGAAGTKFGTLCLPFSIDPQATEGIPDGMQFYKVVSINEAESEITIEQLTGVIAAGTPVIFQFEELTQGFTIESKNATIVEGDAGAANNLVGTFTKLPLDGTTTPKANEVYYLNSDAFHQATGTLTVPAFRAYIKFGESTAKVLNICIDDNETNSIETVFNNSEAESIYDLQGRKQNVLQPGMNIIKMSNGRTLKVIVK